MKYKNRTYKGSRNAPFSINTNKYNSSNCINNGIKYPKRTRKDNTIYSFIDLIKEEDYEDFKALLIYLQHNYSKEVKITNEHLIYEHFKILKDIKHRNNTSIFSDEYNDELGEKVKEILKHSNGLKVSFKVNKYININIKANPPYETFLSFESKRINTYDALGYLMTTKDIIKKLITDIKNENRTKIKSRFI